MALDSTASPLSIDVGSFRCPISMISMLISLSVTNVNVDSFRDVSMFKSFNYISTFRSFRDISMFKSFNDTSMFKSISDMICINFNIAQ